ncbi:ABC transporter ATP-binding protein [Desulfosoma sp.]
MLCLENITVDFRNAHGRLARRVLHGVSLAVEPGEIYGLMGPSGSGKTTLARIAVRLIRPTAGRVLWHGVDVGPASAKGLRSYRRQVQLIFQNPHAALDPKQSVFEALSEPLVALALVRSKKECFRQVASIIEECGLSEDILSRRPHQISGGQAQRVVLARSLALNPQMVIADEPTSMLDVSVQAHVLEILKRRRDERGMAIWLISHDEDLLRCFCERVGVLDDGRLVAEGPPEAVLSRLPEAAEGFQVVQRCET